MGPTGYAAVADGSSGDDGDGVMVVVVVVMMTKMEVEKLFRTVIDICHRL